MRKSCVNNIKSYTTEKSFLHFQPLFELNRETQRGRKPKELRSTYINLNVINAAAIETVIKFRELFAMEKKSEQT